MSVLIRIKNRLIRDLNKAIFQNSVKDILNTAPLSPGELDFVALSMVQHKDVLAYLVAIKSFSVQLHPTRVVVICDPTITDEDRRVIKHHVPFIEFRDACEFQHEDTPLGGTWERLMAITSYTKEAYVVQLDADTITVNSIQEVEDFVQAERSFVLGEKYNQTIITLAQAAENAKDWPDRHVQIIAEKRMVRVFAPEMQYVRGCSGFTGFKKNPLMKEQLVHFSKGMKQELGIRWAEWGTEQVASNFLVANEDAAVLPFPKYSTPDSDDPNIAFRHYIGSIRFMSGRYAADVRATVPKL